MAKDLKDDNKFSVSIIDLLAVGGYAADSEFYADRKLTVAIFQVPGFKAIEFIAKYKVVLVAKVDLNIGTLVLIEYFKLIAKAYR